MFCAKVQAQRRATIAIQCDLPLVILLFVQTRFRDPDIAYEYVRMLWAKFSDAEQLLIALNGLPSTATRRGRSSR